jgi:hypothetical protein
MSLFDASAPSPRAETENHLFIQERSILRYDSRIRGWRDNSQAGQSQVARPLSED